MNTLKKKLSSVFKYVTLSSVLLFAGVSKVFAEDGPGVNEEELKNLVNGYVDPIKNVLIWVVPVCAAIGAAILGVKHFFKTEQEQEDFDLISKLIKLGIVAILIQSIVIVFKIFGVS